MYIQIMHTLHGLGMSLVTCVCVRARVKCLCMSVWLHMSISVIVHVSCLCVSVCVYLCIYVCVHMHACGLCVSNCPCVCAHTHRCVCLCVWCIQHSPQVSQCHDKLTQHHWDSINASQQYSPTNADCYWTICANTQAPLCPVIKTTVGSKSALSSFLLEFELNGELCQLDGNNRAIVIL